MTHLTFRQGVKECIPTLLGYAGVGISFGIVAASQKFSLLEIILLCLIIYAGAAQFIICALVMAGTPITAIVLTTFIVNSRMFLLSMTLAPNFKSYGLWNRIGLGSLVTDETFGVAITPYLKGEPINDRSLVAWFKHHSIFVLDLFLCSWCYIRQIYFESRDVRIRFCDYSYVCIFRYCSI